MVQYGDESIKLSGITSIAPTVLDFTGTTTAETSVTITDLTGYLNGGRISGLKILPPELKQSGSTGTTTVNVENYVLKALDPYGSVGWSPISGISWSVSACTSPLNVTNIVPCTPGGTIYFNAGNLEINNTVRINDGSQVNGYVFTSDGSGNGSWLPPVDNYTTGATLNGTVIEFDRTDLSNAYNVDIKPALLDYLPLRITGNTVVSVDDNVDLYFSGFTGSSIINYVNYGNSLEYINGTVISKDYATLFNRRLTNLETFSIYAISSKGIALDYSDSGGTVNEFYVNKSAMLANSTIPTFQGIKYGSDYSPNYSNRSLVDKEYVDNLVSSTIFTGNTSASCITDLYVTNVHGCSPITFWDSLQTIGSSANGLSSIALGISNTADGISSSAFGGGTLALGSASFAEGYQTLALGDSSHAEGYQTIAGYRALTATSIVSGVVTIGDSVDYSSEFTSGTVLLNNQFYTYTGTSYSAPNFFINLSDNTVIIPLVSVNVVDYNNYNSPLAYISVGDNAHSEGLSTVALGAASHAEGMTTQAIGDISHAEGYQTLAYGVYSHAEGYGSVSYGQYSHAQNNFTVAFGSDSHSEGQGTTAYGNFSHAQGSGTFAVGEGSHAEGYYTNAFGQYSHTEGYQTSATTFYSHAEGYQTTASGNTSHAEGYQTIASGDYSHSEGNVTTSSGLGSHSEGQQTTASNVASHAEGGNTTASGQYSHAEGGNTMASGYASHAEGLSTVAGGQYSHAEGSGTIATGTTSHAEGYYTTANGDYSHAEGYQTTASGNTSHAEGYQTTASGNTSHAEGYQTIASGDYSHSEGNGTIASGNTSHAEGGNTTASGQYSHAEGNYTTASGQYSHAEGFNTIASGLMSHTEGGHTQSTGLSSHAEGAYSVASGQYSHAEGYNTLASGSTSHAEGGNTIASGLYSHAGGVFSHAQGISSFVHSTNSLVTGNRSVILGGQNITGTTDDTVYVPYLNIKNLGVGVSINNLGIDSNGNVVVGTSGSGSTSSATIDPYYNVGSASTVTWDVSGTSTNYEVTLTANTTLNLTNVRNGDYGNTVINQDGVGSRTITLGTVNGSSTTHLVVNGGGGSPTLTATASAVDILSFTYNGSKMFWTVGNDYT